MPMKDKNSKIVYSTDPNYTDNEPQEESSSPREKNYFLKMYLDRKQRAGKSVTVLEGFTESADDIAQLAKRLKNLCASGGTAKDRLIEIQGDHRDKIEKEMTKLGYKIKRSGG